MVSVHSFTVQPRSRFDIESMTLHYLQQYVSSHLEKPGVLNVEYLIDICLSKSHGFILECTEALDEGVEAEVDILRKKIRFSEMGWEALLDQQPRSLFTGAHEIYHVLDHAGQILQALIHGEMQFRAARQATQTYCDAEWQANHGAGALLMPLTTIRPFVQGFKSRGALPFDITEEVARAYGVSRSAAETRISKIGINK